jgi:hypothetical protein
MTVTIMNLYDSYAQATEAVSNLEKPGVPRSDINIVSNNSDNWYSENIARRTPGSPATVDRDRDGVRRSGRRSRHGCWNRRHGGVVGLRRRRPRTRALPVIEPFSVPVYFGLI